MWKIIGKLARGVETVGIKWDFEPCQGKYTFNNDTQEISLVDCV